MSEEIETPTKMTQNILVSLALGVATGGALIYYDPKFTQKRTDDQEEQCQNPFYIVLFSAIVAIGAYGAISRLRE